MSNYVVVEIKGAKTSYYWQPNEQFRTHGSSSLSLFYFVLLQDMDTEIDQPDLLLKMRDK
ncbi:hypothetical protein HID58_038171 [Brassica napus]|uniref:Uncharacterized protein n=1 Tax=Brassica napus TaxID=3708 RepID=A0ABQ8BNJ2_BRANA|nr:hypothetical protein HID58_038171 [Brassica napus]